MELEERRRPQLRWLGVCSVNVGVSVSVSVRVSVVRVQLVRERVGRDAVDIVGVCIGGVGKVVAVGVRNGRIIDEDKRACVVCAEIVHLFTK